jgi:hypothetical protein
MAVARQADLDGLEPISLGPCPDILWETILFSRSLADA